MDVRINLGVKIHFIMYITTCLRCRSDMKEMSTHEIKEIITNLYCFATFASQKCVSVQKICNGHKKVSLLGRKISFCQPLIASPSSLSLSLSSCVVLKYT